MIVYQIVSNFLSLRKTFFGKKYFLVLSWRKILSFPSHHLESKILQYQPKSWQTRSQKPWYIIVSVLFFFSVLEKTQEKWSASSKFAHLDNSRRFIKLRWGWMNGAESKKLNSNFKNNLQKIFNLLNFSVKNFILKKIEISHQKILKERTNLPRKTCFSFSKFPFRAFLQQNPTVDEWSEAKTDALEIICWWTSRTVLKIRFFKT